MVATVPVVAAGSAVVVCVEVVGAEATAFWTTVAAWLAGVAAALATASAWLLDPSSVVVCGGVANGVTWEAAAEAPA